MAQYTILIIDDSQSMVDLLKAYLETHYRTEFALDGETGLRMARELMPDLIILDIMLPKCDGFTISRLLKFDEKYKKIPIIMLTARATEADRIKSLEVGADIYINKPINKEELKQTVANMLGKIEDLIKTRPHKED